jgi:hypothetical protein
LVSLSLATRLAFEAFPSLKSLIFGQWASSDWRRPAEVSINPVKLMQLIPIRNFANQEFCPHVRAVLRNNHG